MATETVNEAAIRLSKEPNAYWNYSLVRWWVHCLPEKEQAEYYASVKPDTLALNSNV